MLGMLGALALATAVAIWALRRTPGAGAAVGALAGLAFGFALAFDNFLPDDSYITYRYAHNLITGLGFTYNPTEHVLSTTTPLYTLILAAFGLVWPDLPVTSHVLSVVALFAGAVIMYRWGAEHGRALAGLLLGALYILNPLTVAVYSSESILHVTLIWAAFYAWSRGPRGWVPAGLLAGLAVVNRGDGALVAIALGLTYLATRAWRRPIADRGGAAPRRGRIAESAPPPTEAAVRVPRGALRFQQGAFGSPTPNYAIRNTQYALRRPEAHALLAYALVTLPWYAFSWLYFGSPAPATLLAKMLQKGVPGTVTFFPGLAVWWNSYIDPNPLFWLLLPLGLLGLLAIIWREQWAGPLLLWAGLYTLGYGLLDVPRYQNYYTPLAPVLLLLAVLGAHWLAVFVAVAVRERRGPGARAAAWVPLGTLALCAGLFVASWIGEVGVYVRLPQPRVIVYRQVGDWLRANTPPDATVGMIEVGTIGYYAERHVIDFYGLIQPDIAQHIGVNDQRWAVEHYRPDYIVAIPNWLAAWRGDPWFQANYAPAYTLPVYPRFSADPVIIYQRTTP